MKSEDITLALEVLRKADWLRGYSPELAESLVAEGRLVRLNAGEWAQAEGDDRSGLFIVIAGVLHSYYAQTGDRVIMLGFATAGAVLGHATRYSGGPRLVTAVCAEPSTMLEISERALDRIAARSPEIWRVIAELTYNNTRSALQLAAQVISLKPKQRIAARLLVMATREQSGEVPVVKISQDLLGEMIGVTRKTINQHLTQFERDGLIKVGYGRIELIDNEGLQAMSTG